MLNLQLLSRRHACPEASVPQEFEGGQAKFMVIHVSCPPSLHMKTQASNHEKLACLLDLLCRLLELRPSVCSSPLGSLNVLSESRLHTEESG